MEGLEKRLRKLEEMAKVEALKIVVLRRTIGCIEGQVYILSELNRSTGEYKEFDLPEVIKRDERN